MRCLWITRQDPRAADSGELIYSRGLLAALAGHGVRLTVLAHRADSAAPPPAPAGIEWVLPGPLPPKRALGVLARLPSDADRLGSPPLRAALRGLLESGGWDWIVLDQAACGWALDEIPAASPARLAYVAHNHEAGVRRQVAADASGPLRLLLRRDAAKYARLERALVARAALVTAITPRDRGEFLREAPQRRVIVLTPGHDGPVPAGDPAPAGPSTPRRAVLAGTFQWIAKRRNLEAFLTVAADPFQQAGVGFQVVGKAEPAYFGRLARRHPWASFEANVPDVGPWLRDARIGLIPEALGGGFKLKALDYVFRGLPLAALEPALSGLPLAPGSDVIAAGDLPALAREVVARIDDLPQLHRLACSALAMCRDAFRWTDRGAALAAALAG